MVKAVLGGSLMKHRNLYGHGEGCLDRMIDILNAWPMGEYCRRLDFEIRAAADKKMILRTIQEFEHWIGTVASERSRQDQCRLTELTELLTFALTKEDYKQNAIDDALRIRDELLSMVPARPISRMENDRLRSNEHTEIQKNTAFIIMAIGQLPHLQDTCSTIK